MPREADRRHAAFGADGHPNPGDLVWVLWRSERRIGIVTSIRISSHKVDVSLSDLDGLSRVSAGVFDLAKCYPITRDQPEIVAYFSAQEALTAVKGGFKKACGQLVASLRAAEGDLDTYLVPERHSL